ncbi:MAG: outer membrane beta-barrel protein [Bacteroidota bacterium]
MRRILHTILGVFLLLCTTRVTGQTQAPTEVFTVTVTNAQNEVLEGAVVEVLKAGDKKLVKSAVTNKNGVSVFYIPLIGEYLLNSSFVGHDAQTVSITKSVLADKKITISLSPSAKTLANVSVTSRKPFIQMAQGKVIVNVDASVTNAGTTVLEVLEKSPGVMVDKNGGISLQGKQGVLVLIDDKQTYLSGADLNNLLNGMSSSQVETIELITSPSAKYDASGNAGIINIKTKKNRQIGFNGVFTTAFAQGRYPKNNNSLVLNYRNGKFNTFLTYSANLNKGFTDIYALRRYYNNSGALLSVLDQPTIFISKNFGNTLKAGFDFYASTKTTLGISLTGISVARNGTSDATASWKNANGATDSAIRTLGATTYQFTNGGINLNAKHNISKTQDLSVDLDMLKYNIQNDQSFSSKLQTATGYTEGSLGNLPSTISIFSAKADYVLQASKNSKLESGYKLSGINTDNTAAYQSFDGFTWKEDLGKSNHFLYKENIQALYASFEQKLSRISFQAGIRYENTHYDGHQLGNSARKDSAFSKNYSGFFPSGYISYQADSSNTFTLTAGRRIDRPPFQKLNPFVTIINKYTFERGNPFFLPQYSWNMELSHQFKQLLTTTISYSIIKDYFSQLFLSEGNDILVYTNGNVGKMYNLGISVAVQATPVKWWTLSGQAIYNHKELKGYQNVNYNSEVSQLNMSMNNQLRLGKTYTAEISGFYTTQARNDLQELLSPTGQLSAGLARPVLNKKGTLKLSVRDIFFTQAMEGNTDFPNADEYFILRRDSRVFNLSFTYRFGKTMKAARRNSGSAGDEIQRVGSGG